MLNVVSDSGKQWYQADALGSVYGLTNQAGALIGSQNYDVFGAPTPAPSGPAGQPFGFTGREHELDSGLVYARARYLSTVTGAWIAPDPIGFADGPARYRYAHSNPVLLNDPSGLLPIITPANLWFAGLGFVMGFVGNAAMQWVISGDFGQINWMDAVVGGLIWAVVGFVSPFSLFASGGWNMMLGATANASQYILTQIKNDVPIDT